MCAVPVGHPAQRQIGISPAVGVLYKARRKAEKVKAPSRVKLEHPYRAIMRQFGYVKTRLRGVAKNTAQLSKLCALSNLWRVRQQLLTVVEQVCS